MHTIKNHPLGFVLLFAVIWSSCTKKVNINLGDVPQKMVVNCLASPDSLWKVGLTTSQLTVGPVTVDNIEDATVEIYEGETFLETLTYVDSPDDSFVVPGPFQTPLRGYYTSVQHHPELGRNYTIKVNAPDFQEQVESVTIIPDKQPTIQNLDYLGKVELNEFSTFDRIQLTLNDIPGEQNYYHFMMKVRATYWEIIDGDTVLTPNEPVTTYFDLVEDGSTSDLVIFNEEAFAVFLGVNITGYIINDASFTDASETFIFHLFEGFYDNGNPNDGYYRDIQMQVRTINEDYYQYQKTLALQYDSKEDPFAEPVFIYNNIQNGLGNFGGFNRFYTNWVRLD